MQDGVEGPSDNGGREGSNMSEGGPVSGKSQGDQESRVEGISGTVTVNSGTSV